MSFTAKDLEGIEKSLSTYADEQQQCYRVKEFKALVARLKASEALHEFTQHTNECVMEANPAEYPCDCGLNSARMKYRQSIGQAKGE